MNINLPKFNKELFSRLMASLEEVAKGWSSSVLVTVKLIAALFSLVALIAAIVVLTQWFIFVYGTGTFIFVLIISSFVMSVLTTFSAKREKVDEGHPGTK